MCTCLRISCARVIPASIPRLLLLPDLLIRLGSPPLLRLFPEPCFARASPPKPVAVYCRWLSSSLAPLCELAESEKCAFSITARVCGALGFVLIAIAAQAIPRHTFGLITGSLSAVKHKQLLLKRPNAGAQPHIVALWESPAQRLKGGSTRVERRLLQLCNVKYRGAAPRAFRCISFYNFAKTRREEQRANSIWAKIHRRANILCPSVTDKGVDYQGRDKAQTGAKMAPPLTSSSTGRLLGPFFVRVRVSWKSERLERKTKTRHRPCCKLADDYCIGLVDSIMWCRDVLRGESSSPCAHFDG